MTTYSWGQTGAMNTAPQNPGLAEAQRRIANAEKQPQGTTLEAAPTGEAPAATWVPRAHPTVMFAKRNKRGTALLNEIPEYIAATEIAERAEELLKKERLATVSDMTLPTTVDEVTNEWLDNEVKRRSEISANRHRAQSLRELVFHARETANTAVEKNAVKLVKLLDTQMQDFAGRLSTLVGELGDGVNTAAAAIDADAATTWKAISQMATEYADIRASQQALYRADVLGFDKLNAGDGQGGDPEAKLYFHRNLNEAAPRWRGFIDAGGNQHPPEVSWPADRTEFFVWAIRHNLGMWCPTPTQIKELLNDLGPLPGAREFQDSKSNRPSVSEAPPSKWTSPLKSPLFPN